MKTYICIDIGGTSIKHGIYDNNASIIETNELPTQAELGGKGIMDKVTSIISSYCNTYSPEGVCISTAGVVDCNTGVIIHAAPLIPNYIGTPIKQIIEKTFSLPCEVENDVNCAALAEYYYGASKGTTSSLCLTVGTGIGGAFILDGNIYHGFSHSGLEVGYMHMLGNTFQELGASSILVKKVCQKKHNNKLNGKTIFELAKQNDADCIHAIEEMVDVLGMGIANICYILNPEIVVLGGGIMVQKEYLYDKIKTCMEHYLIPFISNHTKLAFAQNKNQAGMLGAYCHFKAQNR